DRDIGSLFHPVSSQRNVIFLRLRVAGVARHLVHWRSEQAPALWREIELIADGLGERQAVELSLQRRMEGDDRPALGFQSHRLHAGQSGDRISPRTGCVDKDGSGEGSASLAGDGPGPALTLDTRDALARAKRPSFGPQLPQIALQ